MAQEVDSKSLRALRAYVAGDSSEPNVFSDLKGVPREDVHRVLRQHRRELEEIDPARIVILESIL